MSYRYCDARSVRISYPLELNIGKLNMMILSDSIEKHFGYWLREVIKAGQLYCTSQNKQLSRFQSLSAYQSIVKWLTGPKIYQDEGDKYAEFRHRCTLILQIGDIILICKRSKNMNQKILAWKKSSCSTAVCGELYSLHKLGSWLSHNHCRWFQLQMKSFANRFIHVSFE